MTDPKSMSGLVCHFILLMYHVTAAFDGGAWFPKSNILLSEILCALESTVGVPRDETGANY